MFFVVVVLPLLILATFTAQDFLKAYDHDLRTIPNAHFTVPFSRIWLLLIRWQDRENRTRLALHRKLGPIVRIGPSELSIDCIQDGVRSVYGSEFAKNEWYAARFHGDEVPYMFTMQSKEDHSERKRMLSGIYSNSRILNSRTLDVVISKTLRTLQQTLSEAEGHTDVDILNIGKACIMDITSAWVYGTESSTNFLEDQDTRHEFLTILARSSKGSFWRSEFLRWIKALEVIGISIEPTTSKSAYRWIQRWSLQMTAKALSHKVVSAPEVPVSEHLYDQLQKADPDLTLNNVRKTISRELFDHVVASHDVGGIALAYIMHELSQHPERQQDLRDEVIALDKTKDSSLARRIEELPILDAIVKETLRLRSPNPGPWPRLVPKPGCQIVGYTIPEGVTVSATSWTLHRNATVFPSPEEWRPQRWLEADEVTKSQMYSWFWPYGSGPRMCIGNFFAMRVIKAILVDVYSQYETFLGKDTDMNQFDGPIAGPVSNCVYYYADNDKGRFDGSCECSWHVGGEQT